MGTHKSAVLSISCAAILAGLAAGCATKGSRSTPGNSTMAASESIEQISDVRRSLRAACGKLKDVNAGADDKAALMADAKDLTASAVENWGCYLEYWSGRAPAAYARHPAWDAATGELTAGMRQMLERIEAGDAAGAFKACGAACGKFVALNEQARVRRTSDLLFHFRKAAKPLAEPLAKGDLDAVSAKVAQLREIRDKAMIHPVGGTGTPPLKTQALEAFSSAVDAFGSAVQAADREQLSSTYGKMMAAMETAYDLFL